MPGTDAKKEYELLDTLFDELFPIMRSITGPGIEQSFQIFSRYMPLDITKIPTGTQVFDWTVPPEWHFKSAVLTGPDGEMICDASEFNLHVVNYSESVDAELSLDELQPHLHSIPELPDAVPYVTSYYKRRWGFCLSHSVREKLKPGTYHAKIETEFVDGGVPFAECTLPGESEREILLTSYLCHPSLANNELSGPLVLLALFNRIKNWDSRKFSYRFLLNPETIGSICFLYKRGKEMKRLLEAGLILTCVGGDSDRLRYMASRRSDTKLDRILHHVTSTSKLTLDEDIYSIPFTPLYGSDERQFCSPGFDLPMAQISRSTYGQYDGYHNSLDTKEFMSIENLIKSVNSIETILKYLESEKYPVNQSPFGEPFLGKRDLYPQLNAPITRTRSKDSLDDGRIQLDRILTILNMADGNKSVTDMEEACGCSREELERLLKILEDNKLIDYGNKIQEL